MAASDSDAPPPGGRDAGGIHGGDAFVRQAAAPRRGLVAEFVDLLRTNKKWWLGPIVLAILVLGVLVFLSGTAAAPFVYTLF